ncbi:MAG TPA: glycosyltransferase, partial [Thermoanaerobaculia bacterium]
PFAFPIIEKKQNPIAMKRTVSAIRELIDRHEIDVLHAHLTWDHWLAFLARKPHTVLARTFHSRRTLRRDPFTKLLLSKTSCVCVVNSTFRSVPLLEKRDALFTPPPLKRAEFHPDGPNARELYGLRGSDFVVGAIGKVAEGRGFEEVLHTVAQLRALQPEAKLLLIGHGPHRPALERLAQELGIAGEVIWAGYHEQDLAEHLRAFDVMLFTAPGSDEGHRAVQEAIGCGVPVAAFPIAGIGELLGENASRLVAATPDPRLLARCVSDLRATWTEEDRARLLRHCEQFDYASSAVRLQRGYERAFEPLT